MKNPLLEVGTRYDVEYVGSNLTLAALESARMVGTRSGPEGDEYEFERADGRVVVLHPARIIRAEPADRA